MTPASDATPCRAPAESEHDRLNRLCAEMLEREVQQRRVVPADAQARASALLARYLRRHPLTEAHEITARAAYLDGFRDGYVRGKEDMRQACSDLAAALGQFQAAFARVTELLDSGTSE